MVQTEETTQDKYKLFTYIYLMEYLPAAKDAYDYPLWLLSEEFEAYRHHLMNYCQPLHPPIGSNS